MSRTRAVLSLVVGTVVLVHLPAALRSVVGGNATLISLGLIGFLVFAVRRRSDLGSTVLVVVPAAVEAAITALFVRRDLPVYLAIIGGETLVVGAVAAVGALVPYRGR